jgi:hypothetical protein
MARRKVIDVTDYSALDQYCIGLNEYYKSLRRAGFSVDHSLYLITAPQTYPATILPNLIGYQTSQIILTLRMTRTNLENSRYK